jgi:hypothetical protein
MLKILKRSSHRDYDSAVTRKLSLIAQSGPAVSCQISASACLRSPKLGKFGIRLNVVSPGPVQTGWTTERLERVILPAIPLSRIGTPSRFGTGAMGDRTEDVRGRRMGHSSHLAVLFPGFFCNVSRDILYTAVRAVRGTISVAQCGARMHGFIPGSRIKLWVLRKRQMEALPVVIS